MEKAQTVDELLAANRGKDRYQAPDYYGIDDLLTEEQKLVRQSAREWIKQNLSPIIEYYAQRAEFPHHIIKGLGEIGAFGPQLPTEYGVRTLRFGHKKYGVCARVFGNVPYL
jgi:alkylation response protein AidB-like acyl-CoA dehydrogenase